MGTLTPDANYIYESPDGGHTIYARKAGEDISTRKIIGISLEKQKLLDKAKNDRLWDDIRKSAETNPALQSALEQCIMLYHLSKNGEE
jgi:hypothetical protein